MFKLLATALALVVTLAAIPSTSAFSHVTTMRTKILMAKSSTTRLAYLPQQSVDRALDCANNYGMCDIEELLDLSEGKWGYIACRDNMMAMSCHFILNIIYILLCMNHRTRWVPWGPSPGSRSKFKQISYCCCHSLILYAHYIFFDMVSNLIFSIVDTGESKSSRGTSRTGWNEGAWAICSGRKCL